MKRLGFCVPLRPSEGQAGYAHPARWGCLRDAIHGPLIDELSRLARERGIVGTQVDFRDGYILDGDVWVGDLCLSDLDAYFWYCEVDRTPGAYALTLLKCLANKVKVSPDPSRWEVAVDKHRAHERLRSAGVPVPESALFDAASVHRLEGTLEAWGSALLKPRRGAWGKGVHLVETFAALRDIVGYVASVSGCVADQGFLLERYYPNDVSRWISVTVLGGRVMYGYRKQRTKLVELAPGHFKVFDAGEVGGDVEWADVPEAAADVALRAARALDVPIVGFDMIATARGLIVVDENTSPGNYAELYAAAGLDPAREFCRTILGAAQSRGLGAEV